MNMIGTFTVMKEASRLVLSKNKNAQDKDNKINYIRFEVKNQ